MKDKLKEVVKIKININIYPALVITLIGINISFLICTIMGSVGIFKSYLPIWTFILFTLLYFVFDIVAEKVQRWWLKPLVLGTAALVIIVLLIFI